MKKETKHIIRTLGTILFILYVLALIYFLFFSEEYGRAAMKESLAHGIVVQEPAARAAAQHALARKAQRLLLAADAVTRHNAHVHSSIHRHSPQYRSMFTCSTGLVSSSCRKCFAIEPKSSGWSLA